MGLDQERRRRLIDKIKQQGMPSASDPLPVVSLEDFFTGNDDVGSIGCNLGEHPGTTRFFEVFKLEPDDLAEGFAFGVPRAAPELEPGIRVVSVWWD